MNTFEPLTNVLCIFPTVRGFGYAFFKDEYEPEFHGVVFSKSSESQTCVNRIALMIETYQPTLILLPTPHKKQALKHKRKQILIADIEALASSYDIRVLTYAREQIRLVFEQFDARSKIEIAEKICMWMPSLEKFKPRHRKSYMPEDYYQGMFDAISLNITHQYYH